MAEKSGFFPDINGDREYTAEFLAQWIHSICSNGIFDGDFIVTAGTGMQVLVAVGEAWINGYYYCNDAALPLTLAVADGSLARIDAIILRLNISARSISAQILTGTPAANPTVPSMTRTSQIYDLKLAEINIPAGTTSITSALFIDKRYDSSACGITTTTQIQDSSVTTPKIANGAVTLDKLSSNIPLTKVGTSAPTTATAGVVGQLYYNSTSKQFFKCTAASTTYTWAFFISLYDLINVLSAVTPVSGDRFPFLNVSGSVAGYVTLANLLNALQTVGAPKIFIGSYTGTGALSGSKTVTLGFRPKLYIVSGSSNISSLGSSTESGYWITGMTSLAMSTSNVTMTVSDTAVSYPCAVMAGMNYYSLCNTSGATYDCIAIG